MNKNKIIKNINKALLIGAFLIPFNLMAQIGIPDPSDNGGGSGSSGGTDPISGLPCSDADANCPIDTGTIAIVIAGLAIGTIMMMKNKNASFYQMK